MTLQMLQTMMSLLTVVLLSVVVLLAVPATYAIVRVTGELRGLRLGGFRERLGKYLSAMTEVAEERLKNGDEITNHVKNLDALVHMANFGAKAFDKATGKETASAMPVPPPPPNAAGPAAPVPATSDALLAEASGLLQSALSEAGIARAVRLPDNHAPAPPPPSDGTS